MASLGISFQHLDSHFPLGLDCVILWKIDLLYKENNINFKYKM